MEEIAAIIRDAGLPHGVFPIELTEQAAVRETFEEAHADVDITSLYAVLSLPRISQVHMLFRRSMRTPELKPGAESLDVQLFALADIPWDDLAFPVIQEALERYVADVARGTFSMHFGSVFPRMRS